MLTTKDVETLGGAWEWGYLKHTIYPAAHSQVADLTVAKSSSRCNVIIALLHWGLHWWSNVDIQRFCTLTLILSILPDAQCMKLQEHGRFPHSEYDQLHWLSMCTQHLLESNHDKQQANICLEKVSPDVTHGSFLAESLTLASDIISHPAKGVPVGAPRGATVIPASIICLYFHSR